MQISLNQLIILLGIIQGLILGFLLLFSVYFQNRPNRYLAFTLWIAVLCATLYTLLEAGFENKWTISINDIMWEQLYPVTLLLYFASALGHPLANSKKRLWLFFPFVFTLIINILIDLDMEFGLYQWAIVDNEAVIQGYYLIEQIFTLAYNAALVIWSYHIVKHYPPKVPTKWFKRFWYGSTIVISLYIGLWLVDFTLGFDLVIVVYGAVTLFLFWLTYNGILQFHLMEEQFEIRKKLTQTAVPKPEIASTRADSKQDEFPNLHLHRLELMLKDGKLYRNPELSRDLVAKELGISSGYLSQQLKSSLGLNFSEYINTYRVEEVKRLLVDEAFQQFSILAIGYEAGFNSKSTYYSSFKKVTGLTPSAYRKQLQAGEEESLVLAVRDS